MTHQKSQRGWGKRGRSESTTSGAASGSRQESTGERRILEARFDSACLLWRTSRRGEAAEEFHQLLAADPGDVHFSRYWLAACWFDLDRHDELTQLLAQRDEATALWRYAQALLAFRLSGDTDEARAILQEANRLDTGFLEYLLGDAVVKAAKPVRFGGSRLEDAHSQAALFLPAWRATPGAATWARRVLRVPQARKAEEMAFPRQELSRLPQRNVTWQLGFQRIDDEGSDQEVPIWILAISDFANQSMVYMTVLEEEPTPEAVWREVLSTLRHPLEGRPHRPATLQAPADCCRAWRDMLAEISVECVSEYDSEPIDQILAGMAQVVRMQRLPALPNDIDLHELPQTDRVWQAAFFHSPTIISNDEIGVQRPWGISVCDRQSGFILSNELIGEEPSPDQMWDHLVRSMAHPGPCDPQRPATVEVSDSDCYDFLKPKLRELDIRCVLRDELPELDEFLDVFVRSLGDPDKCALADGAGVTMDQMESFYEAAASYFEQAPWRLVPGEIPIEIRCRGLAAGTRYAIVLGRTGVTLGLVMFHRREDAMALITGQKEWDELSALSVVFEEDAIMAPADLALVERRGWPIATPEAYPAVMRLEPGRAPLSPSSDDLVHLEGCLRTIPDFVASGHDAKAYEVTASGQRFKLRLLWTFRNR
jgi:tetratricopeptide (TPR) repeat protein